MAGIHDACSVPTACRACGGLKLFQIVPVCEACLSMSFQALLASYRAALGFPADDDDE